MIQGTNLRKIFYRSRKYVTSYVRILCRKSEEFCSEVRCWNYFEDSEIVKSALNPRQKLGVAVVSKLPETGQYRSF